MNLNLRDIGRLALLSAFALVLAGCPKAQKKPLEAEVPPQTEEMAADADALSAPGISIGTDWSGVPSLEPVYFGTNRADLDPEARASLKRNAAVVKAILGQTKGVQVRVEGHADQRGTVEYNLALGQRRANALKSYYATAGVPKSLLSTISYGEEHPVCTEENENCWSRNRRGETTLKSPAAIRIPMDKLPAR